MNKTDFRTNYFGYKPEAGLNPYTGFSSFQHFRGEKLYSDVIVKPENKLTETENLECYPVPDYVPENGRSEGYYPDTPVAYIRILWKEFEPVCGDFRYDVIESILDEAERHRQTVMFRLMAHSTRACDDVPEWLKEIIDCPERPDGMRVKDSPTAPEFLMYFSRAIRKIGKRFNSDKRFDMMDISLPGSWGEGHKVDMYPDGDLLKLMDAYIESFPDTVLLGQMCRPDLLEYISQRHPVGWRGDGVGNDWHMRRYYPERFKLINPDLWKTAPISFEAFFWLGEWQRQGMDIDYCIEKLNEWHVSIFNAKSLPIPNAWRRKIDDWIRVMGYHYKINSFSFPETARAGQPIRFGFYIENVGVAPTYHKAPLNIVLDNGKQQIILDTGIDIRSWLPGGYEHMVDSVLPADIVSGKYTLKFGIDNGNLPVYFCTDAKLSGKYYNVGEIRVL